MNNKIIQQKIDAVAKRRKYWRELANALGVQSGSAVVDGLRSRVTSKSDELLDALKVCDPKDSIAIACLQAKYAMCKEILLDFDLDVCNKQIKVLDDQITKLNGELKKSLDSSGFDKLISIGSVNGN